MYFVLVKFFKEGEVLDVVANTDIEGEVITKEILYPKWREFASGKENVIPCKS